ncbi:MAG: PadR family transcriptional regulator [Deltaproteobacteria bacterium]|jgi:DNA-binding PadR family transcriptional regulator|nr:PadR family transcriptional regulator [Deltaproteobacteria bacterium]
MDIELMILGFLMSGPKTGYRLKAISGKLIMFYSITLNKIYPALRKLEGGGYIKKEIVFQTGKPNKHLYSLTPAGKEYFFEKLSEPSVAVELGNPFFVKSFFFRFLNKEQIAAEFKREIESIEETLGDLKSLKKTVESRADEHGQFIYRTTIMLLETMYRACTDEMLSITKKK